MDDLLLWLQARYVRYCDGEWRHHWGVEITTLDNPGWRVRIDLRHTELAGRPLPAIAEQTDEHDRLACQARDTVFAGADSPNTLGEICALFRQ